MQERGGAAAFAAGRKPSCRGRNLVRHGRNASARVRGEHGGAIYPRADFRSWYRGLLQTCYASATRTLHRVPAMHSVIGSVVHGVVAPSYANFVGATRVRVAVHQVVGRKPRTCNGNVG